MRRPGRKQHQYQSRQYGSPSTVSQHAATPPLKSQPQHKFHPVHLALTSTGSIPSAPEIYDLTLDETNFCLPHVKRGTSKAHRAIRSAIDDFRIQSFERYKLDVSIMPLEKTDHKLDLGIEPQPYLLWIDQRPGQTVGVSRPSPDGPIYVHRAKGKKLSLHALLNKMPRLGLDGKYLDDIDEIQAKWWTDNGKHFHLYDLPREIRDLIYARAVKPYIGYYNPWELGASWRNLSLLRTNKRVYGECRDVFARLGWIASFSNVYQRLGLPVGELSVAATITRMDISVRLDRIFRLVVVDRGTYLQPRRRTMATFSAVFGRCKHVRLNMDRNTHFRMQYHIAGASLCQENCVERIFEAVRRICPSALTLEVTGHATQDQMQRLSRRSNSPVSGRSVSMWDTLGMLYEWPGTCGCKLRCDDERKWSHCYTPARLVAKRNSQSVVKGMW